MLDIFFQEHVGNEKQKFDIHIKGNLLGFPQRLRFSLTSFQTIGFCIMSKHPTTEMRKALIKGSKSMHYLLFQHRLFSDFMQHPAIHTDGEGHQDVGKQSVYRSQAFSGLIGQMVFLYQDQGVFCLDGNNQNTQSKFVSNGLHLKQSCDPVNHGVYCLSVFQHMNFARDFVVRFSLGLFPYF